ncbi:leucyl aminopeptidase [Streptomyces sp. NPDC050529]|uniref:leucyl aminopeptidase n=1 Tax=Streptomyces sp. NPDC050529 TaxID=3365624 RepID=UPI0037A9C203
MATRRAGDGTPTGAPVTSSGELPDDVTIGDRTAQAAGMTGAVGRTLVCPDASGAPVVLYGVGDPAALDASALRDAVAAFAQAVPATRLELALPEGPLLTPEAAAQAAVEGVLLARYGYEPFKATPSVPPVNSLTLLVDDASVEAARQGAERGLVHARATALARDLANAPPNMLTAAGMAECAARLAAESGFRIEVFDEEALTELGCGGLLGVNAGSSEPPRMIKLSYTPAAPDAPHLTLVGKGIMYDSGGISLKPSDAVHATMKNDMSGAGAILAAMTALPALECRTAVTAYLMCTDNMPSGTATKLGDVLSIRGGTTVEVINTDAEGRLVMADALVLATEEPTDAIVDIATLTGACLRALGPEIAGVFGNDQPLVTQVLAAARDTGEPAWQLPLARRYRAELDSDIADIKNMGGPNGAAIHAALFLEDFVAGVPWAHIDIAGPAQNDNAASWRPRGCTGFGARLLTELALNFRPVRTS